MKEESKETGNVSGVFPDTSNLPACPFCGNHATIVMHPGINWDGSQKNINIGAMHGLWYVGCSYDFFESLYIGEDGKDICEIAPGAKWFASLQKAIDVWSNRAKPAA